MTGSSPAYDADGNIIDVFELALPKETGNKRVRHAHTAPKPLG